MAINKVILEKDGLVVGSNQLVASGGGITIGQNLLVSGNTFIGGIITFPDGTTQNTAASGLAGVDPVARDLANTKTTTYYQSTPPAASVGGRDIWINSETGFVYENFGSPASPLWAEFGPVSGTAANNTIGPIAAVSANISGTLYLGGISPLTTTASPIIGAMNSANNILQNYIWNGQNGTLSTAEYAAIAYGSNDTSGWIKFGITSGTYSRSGYSVTSPNESFIMMSAPSGSGSSGNLVIATDSTGTTNSIEFYTGGFNKAKGAAAVSINQNNLTVANTVTTNNLFVAGNTQFGNIASYNFTSSNSITTSSLTVNNTIAFGGTITFNSLFENVNVQATFPPATTTINVLTNAVLYYQANCIQNITVNITGNNTTTLDSIMPIGKSVTTVLMLPQNSPAYLPTQIQVDGANVVPSWATGNTAVYGNIFSTDVYTFTVIKLAAATFKVYASQNKYQNIG
jgi:hypothetical protein